MSASIHSTDSPLLTRLRTLADAGRVRQLDVQFARLIESLGGEQELVLAAAMACFELGRGHICLPLAAIERPFGLDGDERAALLEGLAPAKAWPVRLATSPLVGDGSHDTPHTPLVLWRERLYLTRYHDFERSVAGRLRALSARAEFPDIRAALDRLFARDYGRLFAALLPLRTAPAFSARHFLEKYLDLVEGAELAWGDIERLLASAQSGADLAALDALIPLSACCNGQKLAAATAAGRPFAVISGGPGTGKTTTVAKLLAILVETGLSAGAAPAIRLVAPTGKAAARLTESIGAALQDLPLSPEVVSAIPTEAGTLHRLLGVIPGRTRFRHHADNPLHLDVLVVDEASMVDLPMMARLLEALPAKARLILLGDKDQLASVEAGAVLADICSFVAQGVSEPQAEWLSAQSGYRVSGSAAGAPLRDSLCLLTKSWRFDERSGIGRLARACNGGGPAAVERVWGEGFTDIALHPWSAERYEALIQQAVEGYRPYLAALQEGQEPKAVFQAFNGFQILCALREGPFGVEGLNDRIEAALGRARLIAREGEWYAGRAVMVVQNDHGIGLYNGDMGLCLPDEEGRLKVWFEQADGGVRSLLPSRLPPHETVFAMTIHKSQGSEFAHTVLVLPDAPSPLLTRELVYTGITRAKGRLDLYGDRALLAQAVRKKTERYSGLALRLGE
ncbi:exodeoxyribonuclease V subunit alpha [Aeromonas schubertii]|uniref:exodeoxyribonuclease V subunit alpha n=1 Tax=Aeromonas schubertii TaxID=652 RepID=UPI0038B42E01